MKRRSVTPSIVLAALAAAAPSCAGVRFHKARNGLPADLPAACKLELETATLADCLAVLGAPREVEDSNGPVNGRVLTWAWSRTKGWGFFFSVPLSDMFNASLDYDAADTGTMRLRLVFDDAWILRQRLVD